MKKILIVSQKEIKENSLFKQEKNLVEMYELLSKDNEVDSLFLHRDMKKESDEKTADNKYKNIKKYCMHDMMIKRELKKNLTELITLNKYNQIVFMSYSLAQQVLPYIENLIKDIVIIVDYRRSNLGFVLQKYKEESEKEFPVFNDLNREFRINFLQSMEMFQKCDYFIFDENEGDLSVLLKEGVINIISVPDVSKNLNKKKQKSFDKKNIVEIEINNDNFLANTNMDSNITEIDKNSYKINENKKFNLIDTINDIFKMSKSELFFIHRTRLNIPSAAKEYLSEYLMYNNKLAAVSPLSMYSRNTESIQQHEFDMQRRGNFGNWEKTSPMLFSDCFMIKKSFLNKYGYFDNGFKTLDYAIFDFLMRVYQKRDYYCTTRDTVVFKYSNVTRPLSIFKEDKQYLWHKWEKNIF